MKLPESFFGNRYLTFDVRSLWCREEDETERYNTGFSLIDVSDEDIELIDNLIYWFKI